MQVLSGTWPPLPNSPHSPTMIIQIRGIRSDLKKEEKDGRKNKQLPDDLRLKWPANVFLRTNRLKDMKK